MRLPHFLKISSYKHVHYEEVLHGHVLCSSPNIKGAIMFPTISLRETKGLHQDDIQGIQTLYNANTRTTSCIYEILHMGSVEGSNSNLFMFCF